MDADKVLFFMNSAPALQDDAIALSACQDSTGSLFTNDVDVDADTMTITKNCTGSQTAKGSSDNTFTYTLKSNTNVANYNITEIKGKLEVKSQDIELSSVNFTYNGEEQVPTITVKIDDNVVDPSEYNVEFISSTGKKNVGTVTVKITDKAGGTYNIATDSTTYTISAKQLTVENDDDILTSSKKYDGIKSAQIGDVVLIGVIPGDVVSATATATYDSPAIGNHSITIEYALSGAQSETTLRQSQKPQVAQSHSH